MRKKIDTDIVIVGSGIIGSAFAHFVSTAGFKVVLIEQSDLSLLSNESYDGRASAIAYGTKIILETSGLWVNLEKKAEPILGIRVREENSKHFLNFNYDEIGSDPIGYMIENRYLRSEFYRNLTVNNNLLLLDKTKVTSFETNKGNVKIITDNNEEIVSSLLIGSDGSNSKIRESIKVNSFIKNYNQKAIVVSVKHEKPHHGIAIELFRTPGPFAILPLQGNTSSLVWVESKVTSDYLLGLNKKEFDYELQKRFGNFLGNVESIDPRWSYQLKLIHAEKYVSHRVALLGDSAHTLHPLAGQNLNLSFRDASVLLDEILSAGRLGLDIGNIEVLNKYESRRRPDNFRIAVTTNGLNSLFSNELFPIRLSRNIGLSAVNKFPTLKKVIMKYARGSLGKKSELSKGKTP